MAKKKEVEQEVILPQESIQAEIKDSKSEQREALKKKIDDYLNGKCQLENLDYKSIIDLL